MSHSGWWLAAMLCAVPAASAAQTDPAPMAPGDTASEAAPSGPTAPGEPAEAPAPVDERLVYSVDRIPERVFDTARDVEVITGDQLRRKNARTLPEALMGEAGVFMQQTDYGAGSPIVRGLMGKQILLLVDGVKLNNATYRFGPLQYLATIDLQSVDRVEVVQGVGSVLGSDALGGIINVITKKGPPKPAAGASREQGPGAAITSRYSSADGAVVASLETYASAPGLRGIAGGTFHQTGDVRAGGGTDQPYSGEYDERALFANVEWFATDTLSVGASYRAMQQNDVPRTDKYADGTDLQYLYGPQRLQLGTIVLGDESERPWADRTQVTLYWNRQDEAVNEIRASAPTVERQMRDADTMIGAIAELRIVAGQSHQVVYGLDYSRDWIDSSRQDLDLSTGVFTPRRGRYADGATYDTAAAYAQDRFDVSRWVTFTLGARASYFRAAGVQQTPAGDVDLGFDDYAITGTANAVVHATPHVNVAAGVTPGFRAPNLDDISVWEDRSNGVEVPATGLEPERIVDYEVGVKYLDANVSASAFGYYSSLSNLLVRTDGTFRGLPFVDLNGNGVQDPGELAALQKKNIGEASIYGAGGQVRYRPLPTASVFGNVSWTWGENDLDSTALDRIPPLYGALGATWSPKARLAPWLEAVVVFAGPQRRLGTGDLTDTRIGPDGTDGFEDIAIRGGFTGFRMLRVTAAVENLLDQTYKYHGSGVYRPGRQVVVGAELRY